MTTEHEFEPTKKIDCQEAWRFGMDYFGRYVIGESPTTVINEDEVLWWGAVSHLSSCVDSICEEINTVLHMDKYLDGEQMRENFGEQMLGLQTKITERIPDFEFKQNNPNDS